MKHLKEIVIAVLGITIIVLLLTRGNKEDYSLYYLNKYQEHQKEINVLYDSLEVQKNTILYLKNEIAKTDSVIDSADKAELHELTRYLVHRVK